MSPWNITASFLSTAVWFHGLPSKEVDRVGTYLGTGDQSEGNVAHSTRVVGSHHLLKRWLDCAEVASLGSLYMVNMHIKQVSCKIWSSYLRYFFNIE